MCSWKKQATPLIFISVCIEQIKPPIDVPEATDKFSELKNVVFSCVDHCWTFVKEKSDLKDYIKKTRSVHGEIEKFLKKKWKTQHGNKCVELLSAMLDLTERTALQQELKSESRIAWDNLTCALFEIYKLADPDLMDVSAQESGVEIANKICFEIGTL